MAIDGVWLTTEINWNVSSIHHNVDCEFGGFRHDFVMGGQWTDIDQNGRARKVVKNYRTVVSNRKTFQRER